MISFQAVNKKYGKQEALSQVDLNFKQGKVVALIGPNGSGKTTLIKSLLGLVSLDSGDILFENNSVLKQSDYRSKIGYMPQISRFPEHMSVKQLFDFMRGLRKDVNSYDWDLYDQFEIKELENKRLNALSGGMKQKVSAALALLFKPQLLLLDEPTAGLDPRSNEMLKKKLIDFASNDRLIVVTSHILSDLDDLVNEVVYLIDGKLKFQESIAALKQQTKESRLTKMIAERLEIKN
jgi:Cu-processing system ATP-binding protein